MIALLVFGPQKLPEIGRQIGGLMREFRRMSDDVRRTFELDDHGYHPNRYDSAPAVTDYQGYQDYQSDATYPRLDQQALDEGKTVPRGSGGGGGAAVYDSPRPWSFAPDASEPVFASVTTTEPPGPPARGGGAADGAAPPPPPLQH